MMLKDGQRWFFGQLVHVIRIIAYKLRTCRKPFGFLHGVSFLINQFPCLGWLRIQWSTSLSNQRFGFLLCGSSPMTKPFGNVGSYFSEPSFIIQYSVVLLSPHFVPTSPRRSNCTPDELIERAFFSSISDCFPVSGLVSFLAIVKTSGSPAFANSKLGRLSSSWINGLTAFSEFRGYTRQLRQRFLGDLRSFGSFFLRTAEGSRNLLGPCSGNDAKWRYRSACGKRLRAAHGPSYMGGERHLNRSWKPAYTNYRQADSRLARPTTEKCAVAILPTVGRAGHASGVSRPEGRTRAHGDRVARVTGVGDSVRGL